MDASEVIWKVAYGFIGVFVAWVSLQVASEGPRRTRPSKKFQQVMYFILFPVSACTGFQAPAFFFFAHFLGKLFYVSVASFIWPLKVIWNITMIVVIGLVYAWGGLRQSFKQFRLKRRGFYLPRS